MKESLGINLHLLFFLLRDRVPPESVEFGQVEKLFTVMSPGELFLYPFDGVVGDVVPGEGVFSVFEQEVGQFFCRPGRGGLG